MITGRMRDTRNAFTLIELLVVVSIIALLLSILLPSLSAARNQAKRTKCFANLHSIYLALVCYGDDNQQWIPDYMTMGQWGFRVAPGRKNPLDSPYPEAYGVQAVLERGSAPVLLPNGLPKYTKVRPAYLAGDSPVWLCPANPGSVDESGKWKKYGNTYFYRTNKTGYDEDEDCDPFGDDDDDEGEVATSADKPMHYNLDWLNRKRRTAEHQPLMWDNYMYRPAESAMGRPDTPGDFMIHKDLRRPPHSLVGGRKAGAAQGSSCGKYWAGAFADGHVQLNTWN